MPADIQMHGVTGPMDKFKTPDNSKTMTAVEFWIAKLEMSH